MNKHISRAQKAIDRTRQEAADVERVVTSVGDELASRARIIYSRSTWDNTIGGLGYEGTWADVAGLLAELPPSPLVYYKDKNYAGTILPAHSALAKAEKARERKYTDETYDPIEAIASCAPFCVDAIRVASYPTSAKVEWCVSAKDGLIRVQVEIKPTEPVIQLGLDLIKNQHGYIIDWKVWERHTFHGANMITAGGKMGTRSNPSWPHYTLWWAEGTEWDDVLDKE